MTKAITFITVLSRPSRFFWRRTIRSVLNQSDPNWRWLILARVAPTSSAALRLQRLARDNLRVTVKFVPNDSARTGFANHLLRGIDTEFVASLEQFSSLAPSTTQDVLNSVLEHPLVDVLYGDEERIGWFGRRISQTRRPVWSPERMNGQMYLGALIVYRTQLLQRITPSVDFTGFASDYELTLRMTEQARGIVRIAKPLVAMPSRFATRTVTRHEQHSTQKDELSVLQEHLKRMSVNATVEPSGYPHSFLVTRDVTHVKPVSVIIPTRGSSGTVFGQHRVFVTELVKSLIENSGALNVEYVIVFDSDTPLEVLADLKELAGESLRLVPFAAPFNFSSKCNVGAVHAAHENLVFLNDDMECLSENVLTQLTAVLDEPGVGMTGAKLFFEDGTIQHGGHLHDLGNNRINYYGAQANDPGTDGALLINREVSGVTGACMAITRRVFNELGGFSELFPNSYNDVDLCNKVTGAGYRIIWLAGVKLFHFESKSRVPVVADADYINIHSRWGNAPDPYFV